MNISGKPKLGLGLGTGLKISISTPSVPGLPKAAGNNPTVKSPMKVGTSLTVKTPKPKSMPDATDKPSVFFKNEGISTAKHPSVQKLRAFLDKSKLKK
jgi:hypothetical protein